jgi:hypothetical protein
LFDSLFVHHCSFIWTSRAGMQAGAGGMASRAASGRAASGPPAGLLRRGSSVYNALVAYSFKGATLQSDLTPAGALPPELLAALFRAAEAGDLDGVKSLVIAAQVSAPPPLHLVLGGHAASLTPY